MKLNSIDYSADYKENNMKETIKLSLIALASKSLKYISCHQLEISSDKAHRLNILAI